MIWLYLALAGGLGAICRASLDAYIMGRISARTAPAARTTNKTHATAMARTAAGVRRPLPWGIFVVNVLGAFLLGLASASFSRDNPALYAVIGTGFCGGFTTFSTAMMDVWSLARAHRNGAALGFLVGTVVVSVAAAMGGAALGAQIA